MKANLKILSLAFFFIFINYNLLNAQKQSTVRNYFDYLGYSNPDKGEFYWGHINGSFLYILPGKMNNISHGIGVDVGLNIARFFTKKIQLGLFAGAKTGASSTGLFNYKYTSEYQQTFNDNLYYNNLNTTDSTYYVRPLAKDVKSNYINGSFRRYGISFKLPYRFFPLIKVFKTTNIENINIESGNPFYYKDQDYINLYYKGKGLELSFKLIDFFPRINNHNLSFGFLYKQDYMTTAKIENVRFNTFLRPAFFEKFGTIHRFGFKISAELY